MRALAASAALASLAIGAPALGNGLTLAAGHLGVATALPPVFFPASLVDANRGSIVGKAERSDTVTVVFSQQVSQPTLCSGWSNSRSSQSLGSASIRINNGAGATGNDTLTVVGVSSSTCNGGVFHFGTIDLGAAGYVSGGNVPFPSSTIALSQTSTSTTLSLTLATASTGGSNGTLAQVTSGSAAVYQPDAAITDTSSRPVNLNSAASAATIQF